MQNQNQLISRTSAVLLACGLIAGLLPGLAAADKADNQWGPGYQLTPNGLRIDGIRADNPTNRVIFDNDWFFDDFTWLFLAAQAKLGSGDFRGFIVTRDANAGKRPGNDPNADWYQPSVNDFNKFRKLALESGLDVPKHTDGARDPLIRPESAKIGDTQYTLSDGARLIIQQAEASTPDNPLLVFVGGQLTTVATALLEKPSIANRMIVFGAGNLGGSYNSRDGWATYVTAMRSPVVHYGQAGVWHKGSVPGQLDSLPDNPVIRQLRKVKDHGKQHRGIYDSATVTWLFNQSLATGAQRRDLTGYSGGRPPYMNVDRSPYGYLHLPDNILKFEEMIDFQVVVLKDPRVWTQNTLNVPNPIETMKD